MNDPTAIGLFAALVFSHFVADFVFQPEHIGLGKNITLDTVHHRSAPWWMWMSGHCSLHAGAVWVLTGSLALGSAEFLVHFITDHAKCIGWIDIGTDQSIHIASKGIWVLAILVPTVI